MAESSATEGPRGAGLIAWGSAGCSSPGETISGDRSLVKAFPGGVLAAVVDGLGHGQEACLAAKKAIDTLEGCPQMSPIGLVTLCHQELKNTRGAVIGLAILNGLEKTLTWLGVGNVRGVVHRADQPERHREVLSLCRGVLGYQLPPLRVEVLPIKVGDTLIIATDGVRAEFVEQGIASRSPQEIADSILKMFANERDDALVLAARFLGVAHDSGP